MAKKPPPTPSAQQKKLWSSRFKEELHPTMQSFHSSLHFDQALFKEDIDGSLAHVHMLGEQGIIDKKASQRIEKALHVLKKQLATQKLPISGYSDDIHMWIEQYLTQKIGTTGAKLHTARSRNDQIATDVRLYLKRVITHQADLLHTLMETLLTHAQHHKTYILPGYTHLQPAQPITLSFYWLAYFFMLARDSERLHDAYHRINRSPLGAGAFAGVNYPIDRLATMRQLGFKSLLPNAMDAVSDRDFLIEYLATLSILFMHLSRLCEDLIIFTSPQFGFITLADGFSSGSSIMPNKKNPDSLELVRGKSGRLFGHLLTLLTVMKSLPLAYNRDLQEDKEPLFDAATQSSASLNILTLTIKSLTVHPAKMRAACTKGFLLATDVADYLTQKNVPFRIAHDISAAIVRYLEETNKDYTQLSLAEFKRFSPHFSADIKKILTLEQSIQRKKSLGSTSPRHVNLQLTQAKKCLKNLRRLHNHP